ncbi:MAG: 4-hydroxythreonine-4-phosphate dehydrogenase PdxA [Betaproteobacteria bacterium]|nr:4-hydroxythreonine-4-phosphate dehydrogenase PdxA [Betaproteobacteria bacterium]
MGEPAGIGPDICLALAGRRLPVRVVVVGDEDVLAERAKRLGLPVRLRRFDVTNTRRGSLEVMHVPALAPVAAGTLDARNSRFVLDVLDRAIEECHRGTFAAMVTAPVHKGVINDAGIPFTGHTEYLAERLGAPQPVMMLAGGGLRVALATTHLKLDAVPAAITRNGLVAVIEVLVHDLRERFGIARPRILVAGLNPHAGESGHLGREEIEIIQPALASLRHLDADLIGPLPADTLFNPEHLVGADCVLSMFHDQGLPVLKFASFGKGVNITLGLPIIRTSVDHGTALDIAGSGKADPSSLIEAIECAAMLVSTKK